MSTPSTAGAAGSPAGVRPRAAFLHISKCAGSSVFDALLDATGRPPQPDQQFDTCYVAGIDQPELLQPAARAAVAWADVPTGVGPHVFFNHWSLPTLRRFFEPGDIATVLREPMMRVLSFVEFARSLPASNNRAWLPDTIPTITCTSSLLELLLWAPAGRATDNLITRQALWRDPRVPVGGFIDDALAPHLAADAIVAFQGLGMVGVVEHMPGVWQGLSKWLGAEVRSGVRNVTPDRQVPGLVRRASEVPRIVELLHQRTRADAQVWRHFAEAAGVGDAAMLGTLAEEGVARRLDELCATAFFAGFHRNEVVEPSASAPSASVAGEGLPESIVAAVAEAAAGASEAEGPAGVAWPNVLGDEVLGDEVLVVDLPAASLPPLPGCTFVTTAADAPAPRTVAAQLVVTLADRELVNLRDALIGHDYPTIVVGPRWCTRQRPAELFQQLAELAPPHARLLLACDTGGHAGAPAVLSAAGWGVVERRATAWGELLLANAGAVPVAAAEPAAATGTDAALGPAAGGPQGIRPAASALLMAVRSRLRRQFTRSRS